MVTTPFPVSPVLTGVALAYSNGRMIADDVSPRRPVGGEQFKYYKHLLGEAMTIPDTTVGRKSVPTEVEFSLVEVDASTADYGLDDVVPNKDIETASLIPGYNPLNTATENLTDILVLSREVRVAGTIFNTANYNAANKLTLAGNDRWDDYANSDPVDDHKAALTMAKTTTRKPPTATPAAAQTAPAPAPDPGADGDGETNYRVLSAIKYGGQWHCAGDELTLPADIAATLVGRVEEIG